MSRHAPADEVSSSSSPFWRQVVTVLTGSVAAQALPLLAAPMITRLCTPEQLGVFSVWFGIVSIAAVVATLRLEAAMILDAGVAEQRACFDVVAYAATLLALLLTALAPAAAALGLPLAQSLPWFALLTIGIGMWLVALMQTVLAYGTSRQAFGRAARAKVAAAGAIVVAQLLLLFSGATGIALMAGQLLGLALGLVVAVRLLAPPLAGVGIRPTPVQRAYLAKHRAFWTFALPADLINAVAGQLPLLLIGAKHGVLAAGLFALTQRVLSAPIALLASSVLEVFKRQSVQDFHDLGNCAKTYRHTFKVLVALACGPTLILFFFSPQLFAWVFGPNWREAGELARLLAPLCFFRFVASPLSYVFYVAGKQKIDLLWQIALLLLTLVAFVAPLTLKQGLLCYVAGYSLLYVVYLLLSYHYSKNIQDTR